jgi:hypothetical protein
MIPVIFDWGRDREGERWVEKGREGERRGVGEDISPTQY